LEPPLLFRGKEKESKLTEDQPRLILSDHLLYQFIDRRILIRLQGEPAELSTIRPPSFIASLQKKDDI